MAYNPADFELVDAPAGSAPPYNPADFDLVAEPEGSGFLRQAADLPVSAMGGVVTGLKGMTDVFGANNPVSQELGSYQQFYNQALSPEAQADQQEVASIMQEAQDKGMWEQIKAGGRAFAVAPLDTMAQSLGTMAPIVATGVAGKALGLGARGVQVAQAVAGSGMQAGTVKDEIYQNTKQFLMQRGKSEEEADRVALEAQSYGGQNLDQILLGAGLGALDAVSGVESILGKTISKTGREVTGGVIVNALKTGVKEAIPEALQGGQEPLAKNIALQRQGYDVPTMRGVLAQGTMEGLAGFAAGAPVGAAEGFGGGYDPEKPVIDVSQQPPAFVPPPAAATADIQEAFGDPTTAAAEPAATQPAASSYNPDDFEVVEMPGETIVTEPPAAPAFQFDLADDTATATEVDDGADVFSGVPQQQPTGPQSRIDVSQETDGGSTPPGSTSQSQAKLFDGRERGGITDYERKQEWQKWWKKNVDETKTEAVPVESEPLGIITVHTTKDGQRFTVEENKIGRIFAQPWQPAQQPAAQPASLAPATFASAPSREAAGMMARDMVMSDPSLPPPPPAALDVLLAITNRANRRGYDPSAITEEAIKSAKKSGYITKSQNPKLTEDGRAKLSQWEGMARERWLALSSLQDNLADQAVSEWDAANDPTSASAIEARQQQPADTPAKRSRRRIKNMTAQSGAIDLSIVEDLVEYGKTIYRAGMSFVKWAGQMVKEFGQGIASFLKQAFDRIVQAYKDSPYSDTTGAVGNVQPKMKPRQFEEKAKKSDAVTEEAKAELGSEYVPITLRGTAEQAKEWINQNGIDAAEQRILDLANEKLTPTPIDFGIGLEMAARLGAMGEHQRQARVFRIISSRSQSIGQTISMLAMLSRLTPEGIVFYANQVIEEHIDSLPEDRKKQIRAAQEGIVSDEKETKATRKTAAEDTIISGTQGGEKIQEKLKRRIPDKAQKQRTNVGIRSVLTSDATKAEATKQITKLLTESGISESESGALASSITDGFYKVLDKSRRAIATRRYPKEPKLIKIWSKLVAKLNGEGMSDSDFIASLSIVAKLPTMTPELGATLKDLTRQLNDAKGDEDMQLVIAGRIFEEVHSLVPVDFWIKVRAFSYLMMLFSPRTWIRNIGGNTIQWVANAGSDTALNIVGGRVGILSNGKTGDRLRGGRLKSLLTPVWDIKKGMEWNAKQNPQATLGQNIAAGIDHLRLLSKLTTQNKFEIADAKEVGRRVFSSKFMNMLDTSLSIALGAPDRAFWRSGLEASLNNREAIAIQMGEWTGRHTPEDVDGAYADAAAAIYQNANTISRESAKLRSSLNRGSTKLLSYFIPGVKPTDQFGFGTALMAFTQVPGAIVRSSINWSPLGLITNLSQAMNGILWKASNQRYGKPFNQQEFAQAFTRALGGTGIYMAGYYLYAMGVITASQEDDDDLEAMRKASGFGQYRINVTALKRLIGSMAWATPQKAEDGDLMLSYDWAQPLAITFAAGAELAKMVEQNDRNGIKKGLAAKAAMPAISLAAGAKSLLELPLLSGLSGFIDQIDTKRPETVISAISRTVMGMPSMFVPQLVRQAAQLSDNTARETRGSNPSSAIPVAVQRAFNQIAANTPGVSDQFPPRMDVLGMAQERYQYGGNTVFNVLINPSLTSRVKTNPALQEVTRLMQSTGETRQLPRAVSRMADINGKKIDLTNEQISAYQYYLGNYTMSMFNWRMASPRYARLPDIEKVKLLAQDLEDVNAATKSAIFGHDVQRLTRRQRSMRANLVNSPLGQSMPPR